MVKLGPLKVKSRNLSLVKTPAVGVLCHNHVPPTVIASYPSQYTIEDTNEWIQSTSRPKAERFKTNWVHHKKQSTRYLGSPGDGEVKRVFLSGAHSGHSYSLNAYHFDNSQSLHNSAITAAYDPTRLGSPSELYYGDPQVDLDDNITRLQPDLQGISLPNFLLELDDIPKLFRSWKEKLASARKLAASGALPKSVGAAKRLGNKAVAGASNEWLEHNFGLLPLVGDLSKIHEILFGLYAKLREFEKAANEVFTHKRSILKERKSFSGTATSGAHHAIWNGARYVQKGVGLKYRLNPLAVTTDYTKMLKAYMSAFGFNLNPRIIWDAIPFTFVLDWFLDVGSWLERHKIDTLQIPITLIDGFAWSRAEWAVTSTYVHDTEGSWAPYTSPGWATVTSHYVRVPVEPSFAALTSLNWKNPTLKQWSLGVSLVSTLSRWKPF